MIWQRVLDVIDAIESWIAGQSYWIQVAALLAVLGPLCYLLAGLIDRAVEAVLAWHSRRDPAESELESGTSLPDQVTSGASTPAVTADP